MGLTVLWQLEEATQIIASRDETNRQLELRLRTAQVSRPP
jgi:hypothetical protein